MRLPYAERKIDDPIREHALHGLPARDPERRGIDQQRLLGRKAKILEIVFPDVVIEAVVLLRVHGVELINLHKVEALHIGAPGAVDTVLRQKRLDFLYLPCGENAGDPFNKVLRGFSRRQGNDSARVFQHPFNESQRSQFSQKRKVVYFDDSYLFRWRVPILPVASLQLNSLHRRTSVVGSHLRVLLLCMYSI